MANIYDVYGEEFIKKCADRMVENLLLPIPTNQIAGLVRGNLHFRVWMKRAAELLSLMDVKNKLHAALKIAIKYKRRYQSGMNAVKASMTSEELKVVWATISVFGVVGKGLRASGIVKNVVSEKIAEKGVQNYVEFVTGANQAFNPDDRWFNDERVLIDVVADIFRHTEFRKNVRLIYPPPIEYQLRKSDWLRNNIEWMLRDELGYAMAKETYIIKCARESELSERNVIARTAEYCLAFWEVLQDQIELIFRDSYLDIAIKNCEAELAITEKKMMSNSPATGSFNGGGSGGSW